MKYENVLAAVGGTPVIRVNKLAPPGTEIWVKYEAMNPMGSVKDRMALGVIEAAEASGALSPGQTVVEATSGNTGIGLAMVCAQKGYPLVIVMPENFSVERRKLMRFLGARVVLTPAPARGIGMLNKARELADTHGWFMPRQFENEANADMHSRTTAREILADFEGERLDYWVTGFGTGGTLKGVSRVLKAERSDTRIIVAEPDNSQMLASGIAQEQDGAGLPTTSHPAFRTHLVQGWSPDFVPKLAEDARKEGLFDGTVPVGGQEAMDASQALAREEGIFTGISGGATFAGAVRLARMADPGARILCMLPDTGERYLSTPLFENIAGEMNSAEEEISRSTPNYRFDQEAVPAIATPDQDTGVDRDAAEFVEAALSDRDEPVVVFVLEWCEFCWAIRRMLAAMGVSYRAIELDSAEAQIGDWGGRVRDALSQKSGSFTVPQVFVGGEFVGGCTETLDAFDSGDLQSRLDAVGATFTRDLAVEAKSFLPGWLHARNQSA